MRTSTLTRTTAETDIALTLNLDGSGKAEIVTGCGFLDHMLTLLAKHASFDLSVACKGDTHVDDHHTVEDVGIVLGTALAKALGDKKGIGRYGSMALPMDESLVLCAVDLSGRACLGYALEVRAKKVGTFDTELVEEFWLAFTRAASCTMHLRTLAGRNSHHIIECAFKAAARSLRQAVAIDREHAEDLPSTKGML